MLEQWKALSDEQVVADVLGEQMALLEVLMRRHALPTEEIVFFDDGIANVDAAKRLGMKAYLVENPAELRPEQFWKG